MSLTQIFPFTLSCSHKIVVPMYWIKLLLMTASHHTIGNLCQFVVGTYMTFLVKEVFCWKRTSLLKNGMEGEKQKYIAYKYYKQKSEEKINITLCSSSRNLSYFECMLLVCNFFFDKFRESEEETFCHFKL